MLLAYTIVFLFLKDCVALKHNETKQFLDEM